MTQFIAARYMTYFRRQLANWSHGVMVSTLDFESSDPSSNLGGTSVLIMIIFRSNQEGKFQNIQQRQETTREKKCYNYWWGYINGEM